MEGRFDVLPPPASVISAYSDAAPRRALTSSEAPVELSSQLEPASPSANRLARRAKTALWVVSGACGVLALALGLSLRALRARPLTLAVRTNVPASTPQAPKAAECSLQSPAAKLASSIERGVEPVLVQLDENRAALGFAASAAEAQGIVVDLATLDVTRAFSEVGEARVSQVLPSVDGPLRFSVARDEPEFSSPRAFATLPPSELGVTKEGVVSRSGGEKKLLWPLPPGHGAELRAARNADGRYRIIMRRGGAEGELVTGLLGPDGRAQGELEPVETGVHFLGTPAIASAKESTLIAFAGRDQKSDPFRLRLASIRAGQRAARAVDFPAGANDGTGAIAPAVAALGDDAWVLQWTQGEAGRYRVFVQAVSAELAPLGPAIPVSPMGANAGQGLVRSIGERTLSLFVLPVPGHDELWGAVLKCR